MAKSISLHGVATGKLGGIVYSVNSGQMIAREYQPNVSNPNTEAQVNQRAKLKLMSQVAAALAPVIVIPKEGLKSSRNLFIKKNFDKTSADGGVAQVTYENLQITAGNAALPAIELTRSLESGITARLSQRADASISRVVYISYSKTSENTLQYMQSIIVDNAGADGTFPGSLLYLEGDVVVFAYGMKDLTAKARAKYAEYNVASGEDIARLAASRNISYSDYQFTQTRGTTLFAGESESTAIPDGSARVFVTAGNGGSVAGAGVFQIGQNVTVTATPAEGFSFVGWYRNGSDELVSSNAQYSFTLQGTADLVARFRDDSAPAEFYITLAQGMQGRLNLTPADGIVTPGNAITVRTDDNADVYFYFTPNGGSRTEIGQGQSVEYIPQASGVISAVFNSGDE